MHFVDRVENPNVFVGDLMPTRMAERFAKEGESPETESLYPRNNTI